MSVPALQVPRTVQAIYEDWARNERTGVVELHFQHGKVRCVKVTATVQVDARDEVQHAVVPAPLFRRNA